MQKLTRLLLTVTILVIFSSTSFADEVTMKDYLINMPKAEIHLHIEGTLTAEKTAELANKNKLDYFLTAEEVRESLNNREVGLKGFLSHYLKSVKVLKDKQDFYNATFDLIRKLHDNKVIYADLFFDPQEHTQRGISFTEFFEGIDKARVDAQKAFGIEVNLIMCFARQMSAASAMEMIEQAEPFRDRIIGVGMDSGPEYGNPPIKFKEVYAEARKRGYKLSGHHDVHVQDSQKHIWQSINIIKMDRIDHGLDASQSPELMAALKANDLCLTGSPVKRSSDPEPQDLDWLKILDENGVCVSINTDDPTHFETGYITKMLIMVQEASGFTKVQMTRFMFHAFKPLYIEEARKHKYIKQLKDYAESHGVNWAQVVRS